MNTLEEAFINIGKEEEIEDQNNESAEKTLKNTVRNNHSKYSDLSNLKLPIHLTSKK